MLKILQGVDQFGKKIHVVGAPLMGFDTEVVHNSNLRQTKYPHLLQYYFLGYTSGANTVISDQHHTTRNLNPRDNFENKALRHTRH